MLRPIASLLGGTALLLLGVGLLNTLIPLRGGALGYSKTLLGALTSAYYAGYFAGTIAAPLLVRRVGHIRAFAFCTSSVACVVLLHAIGDSPLLWIALRALAGAALVGLYTIIESWLNAQASPQQRSAVFAAYMVVNLGSLALGQQLLRIQGQPFMLFTLVALLLCAATLPVVVTGQAQPSLQSTPRLHLRRLFADTPSAAVAALASGLAMGAFWGLLPVYAHDLGFNATEVGSYMSVAIVGGALLQLPLGRISDRYDRRVTLALVCGAASLLALVTPIAGASHAIALALIFLYGGMTFSVYPIMVAHLVDRVRPQDLLAASSSVLLVYGVGSALGPLAAGALMAQLGSGALFVWFALMQGASALYSGYRFYALRREPIREENFQPMLRTTPAALEMLPETEGQNGRQEQSRV